MYLRGNARLSEPAGCLRGLPAIFPPVNLLSVEIVAVYQLFLGSFSKATRNNITTTNRGEIRRSRLLELILPMSA